MSPSDIPSERSSAPPNWAKTRHAITARYVSRAFGNGFTSFRRLEADILESLGGLAVEVRSGPVVAAASGQVALCHPRGRPVADRGELLEVRVGGGERLVRLVQAALLEERAPEDEL